MSARLSPPRVGRLEPTAQPGARDAPAVVDGALGHAEVARDLRDREAAEEVHLDDLRELGIARTELVEGLVHGQQVEAGGLAEGQRRVEQALVAQCRRVLRAEVLPAGVLHGEQVRLRLRRVAELAPHVGQQDQGLERARVALAEMLPRQRDGALEVLHGLPVLPQRVERAAQRVADRQVRVAKSKLAMRSARPDGIVKSPPITSRAGNGPLPSGSQATAARTVPVAGPGSGSPVGRGDSCARGQL
jgi:hypothetical protein